MEKQARQELGKLILAMLHRLMSHKRWKRILDAQAYLAHRAGVGVDAVRNWIGGVNRPSDDALEVCIELGATEAGMEKAWAEQTLSLARHPDQKTILSRVYPSPAAHVRHNLPPRTYFRLIGREDEIKLIRQRLEPESRFLDCSIQGIGGVGKSALALEVGWRCAEEYDQLAEGRRFDYIIWLSAKRAETTTGGIHALRPTMSTIRDLYRAIAAVLEYDEILRVSEEEQPRIVERALREAGRTLLILDNLESLGDITAVLDLIETLPRPTRVLTTMRAHEDIVRPIRLRELDKPAAQELIQQECAARGIQMTEEQASQLFHDIRGLPLGIWLAVGMMGRYGYSVKKTLTLLKDAQGDLLAYIFGAQKERLRSEDPDAYKLWLALSLFDLDEGATSEALRACAALSEEECAEVVHRLAQTNLIYRQEQVERFTMLPLTNDYVVAERGRHAAWEHEVRERWRSYYQDYAERNRSDQQFDALEAEKANLWQLMDWLVAQRRWDELASLLRHIHGFLYGQGYWDVLLRYGDLLAEAGITQGNPHWIALTLYLATNIFRKRDDDVQGKAWLARADLAVAQTNDEPLRAETLLAYGHLWDRFTQVERSPEEIAREGQAALAALNQAARMLRAQMPGQSLLALNALGNCYRWLRQYEAARDCYWEGATLLEQLPPEEVLWNAWRIVSQENVRATFQGNLALIAGDQGRFEEALSGLQAIFPYLMDTADIIEVRAAQALYLYRLGRHNEALLLRAEADRRKKDLHLTKPLSKEDAEWEHLHEEGAI